MYPFDATFWLNLWNKKTRKPHTEPEPIAKPEKEIEVSLTEGDLYIDKKWEHNVVKVLKVSGDKYDVLLEWVVISEKIMKLKNPGTFELPVWYLIKNYRKIDAVPANFKEYLV